MTPKTRSVLVLKANGLLNKQIAKKLDMHVRTVQWHIQSACTELEAVNSVNAVAIAMRDGLILAGEIVCVVLLCWSGLVGEVDARRTPSPTMARTARRETIV